MTIHFEEPAQRFAGVRLAKTVCAQGHEAAFGHEWAIWSAKIFMFQNQTPSVQTGVWPRPRTRRYSVFAAIKAFNSPYVWAFKAWVSS